MLTHGRFYLVLLYFFIGMPAEPCLEANDVSPGGASSQHLSDEQNRALPVHLSEGEERLARASALYAQALSHSDSVDPYKTIQQLRQVCQLYPQFVVAQVRLSQLLMQIGQNKEAVQQLESALKLNPNSASLQSSLGYALHLHGENEIASQYALQALRADSTQSEAMRVILESALEKGSIRKGFEQIKDILIQGGDKVTSDDWMTLEHLYLELSRSENTELSPNGLLQDLLTIYQNAAGKSPASPQAILKLSDTYKDLGRKQEALNTLVQALDLDPDNVSILMHCAELESDLNLKPSALHHYEMAYTLNSTVPGLRQTLARLYLETANYPAAVKLLTMAIQENPRDADATIELGLAYVGNKQRVKAQEIFTKLLTLPMDTPEPLLKLAVFQLARHEVKSAGITLDNARKRFPNSLDVCFYQAVQLRTIGKYDDALSLLKEVRSEARENHTDIYTSNFYIEMALTSNLAGDDDLAEEILVEGLNKYPESAELLNELAYFWVDHHKRLSEAEALSLKAVRLEPNVPALLDTLGWIYFQQNRMNDALANLQEAARLTQNDPVLYLHLGELYLKLGERKKAYKAWTTGLIADPDNTELRKRMKSLKDHS